MTIDTISVTRNAHVLALEITRPAKKNALTGEMYSALARALEQAATDPDMRVALVSGAGGVFTAGNDVGDFLSNPPTGPSPVDDFLRAILTFPKPLVAAVHGLAVGIGTTLLLHCDYVVAASDASFRMPFVDLGLCPEAGSTVLLPLFAGQRFAQKHLLLGLPFGAEEALQAGVVSEVVAAQAVLERAQTICSVFVAKPTQALQATKAAMRGPWRAQVEDAMMKERASFAHLLQTEESRAIMSGFLAKSKAANK